MFLFRKSFWKQALKFNLFEWWITMTVNSGGHEVELNKPHPQLGNRFSRGASLTLTLTTRCPIMCAYCPIWLTKTDKREWKAITECPMDEWKELIEKFPEWVSFVGVSGGEPTLITWMPEFVNWLIDSGRKVMIYSVLWKPETFKTIRPSSRLAIQTTFHHKDIKERFVKAYNQVKGYGLNIEAFELDSEPKVLDFTTPKPFISDEMSKYYLRHFHCSPDSPKTRIVYLGTEHLYNSR